MGYETNKQKNKHNNSKANAPYQKMAASPCTSAAETGHTQPTNARIANLVRAPAPTCANTSGRSPNRWKTKSCACRGLVTTQQRERERERQRGACLVILHQVDEGLLLPKLQPCMLL